jgi:hypothetical protein
MSFPLLLLSFLRRQESRKCSHFKDYNNILVSCLIKILITLKSFAKSWIPAFAGMTREVAGMTSFYYPGH